MTNNKARRVNVVDGDYVGEVIQDDPSGTHHLAPVDEYEAAIKSAFLEGHRAGCSAVSHLFGEEGWLVSNTHRALAEIGGEDE